MAAAAILIFKNSKFQRSVGCSEQRCVIMPNFAETGHCCVDIALWRFFSKWRPSAILDLLDAYLEHPRRVLGGLYRWAKFGWNWWSNFHNINNMEVLICCTFGLKTPTHAPQNGGAISTKLREAHSWAERRRLTHRSSKSVHQCDLRAWRRDQKRKITKETWQWEAGYSPIPPTSSHRNAAYHGGWSSGGSYKFQVSSKSVVWFPSWGRSKIAYSHCIGQWIYTGWQARNFVPYGWFSPPSCR